MLEKFLLCRFCGECDAPIPLDVCVELGHNPGTDGHMLDTLEEAIELRELYIEDNNLMKRTKDPWRPLLTSKDVGIYQVILDRVG